MSMSYANIHGHIHHIKYDDKRFFNVCVECIDYTPISFEQIKEAISKGEESEWKLDKV